VFIVSLIVAHFQIASKGTHVQNYSFFQLYPQSKFVQETFYLHFMNLKIGVAIDKRMILV